jgi:hypothetical protein
MKRTQLLQDFPLFLAIFSIFLFRATANGQQISRSEFTTGSTDKGAYQAGEKVLFSVEIYNPANREIKLKDLTIALVNLVTGKVLKTIGLAPMVEIEPRQTHKVNGVELLDISSSVPNGPYGVYVMADRKSNPGPKNFITFFRVKDPKTLTCFDITKDTIRGITVFRLDGGMSAEYAIEKAAETLSSGLSHSWEVNAPGSGPNQVYSTPQFLINSVNETVDFYDQTFGHEKDFNTVIIGTGIPSIPYLSNALQAPVLPLHFLVSANTAIEIQSILDYSQSQGYSCYSTLGYDASVPSAAVAWVKLLDLPKPYVDFVKRHHVKNLILFGATGGTGGETMARLINLPGEDTPSYRSGSIYLLYPQGGVSGDEQAFHEKLMDYEKYDLQKPLIRIADWESGIIEKQVQNFTKTAIKKAGIKEVRFITAKDDGDLYKFATYVSAALYSKNNLTPKGVMLNPYLISNPYYESWARELPFVYWQGNPATVITEQMQSTIRAALTAYFPGESGKPLDCWLNASRNFGGPERTKLLQQKLGNVGSGKIHINDLSVDEVWNPSDGLNAPCELKFKEISEQHAVGSFVNWANKLAPLTFRDLDEISQKFPSIIIQQVISDR